MKTRKIIPIVLAAILMVSLTGCFPFNMLQDLMQNNQSVGGADGPTSVVVGDSEYHEPADDYDNEDDSDNHSDNDFDIQVNVSSDNDEYDDYDDDDDYDDYDDYDNGEVQRIGSAGNGYVDVPSDYVRFVDDDTSLDILQYSDPSGINIVTLSYFENVDAYSFASSLLQALQSDTSVDQSTVTGAMVELDDCEAYQVYGYYPDEDKYLVIWVLDSPDDDYVHYIAVEFTSDNYDLFEMVEDTYHVSY